MVFKFELLVQNFFFFFLETRFPRSDHTLTFRITFRLERNCEMKSFKSFFFSFTKQLLRLKRFVSTNKKKRKKN